MFWRLVQIVTMEDIALEVGCSVNTVSRAINNKPDISERTRKKVLDAAKRLGYVPNTLAKSLVTRKTGTIGIVVPNIINPIYAKLVDTIEKCTLKYNYNIFLSQSLNDLDKEAEIISLLYQKRVDGLLVVPFSEKIDNFDYITQFNIPTILMLNDIPSLNFSFIGIDNNKCIRESISYLVNQECKNTLIIENISKPKMEREKNIQIYKNVLKELSIPFNEALVINTELTTDNGYNACKEAIDKGLFFDSIFVFNDIYVPGIYKALKENSINCPEDVKIIGYGNIDECQYYSIPLSSNEINTELVGQKSVELLMKAVKNQSIEPIKKILEPTNLIIRSSS